MNSLVTVVCSKPQANPGRFTSSLAVEKVLRLIPDNARSVIMLRIYRYSAKKWS